MIIIIDGYNLLKQLVKADYATQQQRQWFVTYLDNYARLSNNKVVIVFDGGPYKFSTWLKRGQTSIVYSGSSESADDFIKYFIQENFKKEMLVVSSDRMITGFAFSYKVTSIDALVFYQLAQVRLQGPVTVQKGKGVTHKIIKDQKDNPELDALMEQASSMMVYKDEIPSDLVIKNSPTKKLSKEEKHLLRIIKKI